MNEEMKMTIWSEEIIEAVWEKGYQLKTPKNGLFIYGEWMISRMPLNATNMAIGIQITDGK